MTARDIAERLRVTPATVLRWTRNGDLPAVVLPSGQIRYPEQAFVDWLAARTTPGGIVATQLPPNGAALAAPSPIPVSSAVRHSGRLHAVPTEQEEPDAS